MKLNSDKLYKLQKIAESQRNELAKIEGKMEVLLEDLKEVGYESIEEARKKLIILNKKLKAKRQIFDRELDEFTKKHAETIQKNNQ